MIQTKTPPTADSGGYGQDEGTDVATLVTWLEDAEEATDDARKLAERDRDYYDHKQLTSAEKAELKKRGQPDVIINRIKPKIDFLVGFEASNRTDPRAFPRTPQDESASEVATDALRYVADRTELPRKLSCVWENMLVEGFGGVELVVEQGREGPEINVVEWDWDRLFYDPHSRKLDFSDARYLGGYIWMDAEDAKTQWPDAADLIETTINDASFTQTYDDRPRWKTWVSGKTRKRIRVVQMYHREGHQWMYCVFVKAGKLDSYPVPFTDQDGMSWCPLMLQSAHVDRDNNRYGLVRTMIDVQDEINKRRSRALHRITMRQVVTEHGAVEDIDEARLQLSKPDGIIIVNPGSRFEMLQAGEQLTAELSLLQEAKSEIELMGPNSALQGKDGEAPSGKAIQLNRQSGQTEITMLLDRHKGLKQRVYRRIWDLIRQYKQDPWWVRVTDNADKMKHVGLNRPVTMAEEIVKRAQEQGTPPEQAQMMIQQAQADPIRGPMLQEVVRVDNQVGQMWMDITVEDVPDTSNIQEEQFNALVQLAPAVTFPPAVYLKASNLRNKKELLDELAGGETSPEKQQAIQLEMAKAKAELDKIIAEIDKTKAEALKIRVEADMAQIPEGVIVNPRVIDAEAQQAPMMPPPGPPMAGPMPPVGMQGPPELPMQQPPGLPVEDAPAFSNSVPPPGSPGVPPMPPPGF